MKRPKVVLVDDLPEIIEYCSAILRADYDIVGTAQSGKRAIAVCEEVGPDVMVLDISMPSLSGIEVAAPPQLGLPSRHCLLERER